MFGVRAEILLDSLADVLVRHVVGRRPGHVPTTASAFCVNVPEALDPQIVLRNHSCSFPSDVIWLKRQPTASKKPIMM
jgi:hypothetical protein